MRRVWSARPTGTVSSPRCSRRRNIAARCTRSMPLMPKWHGCGTWRTRRLPGEIRLQWWSEVIDGERADEARANPVAAALLATIERYRLSPDKLIDLIEAHRFDLYDDPMASVADLETYASRTSSTLFACATQILAGTDAEAVCLPAGIAYCLTAMLRAFPQHVARRQLFVPGGCSGASSGPFARSICRPFFRWPQSGACRIARPRTQSAARRWKLGGDAAAAKPYRLCFRWRSCGVRSTGWSAVSHLLPRKFRRGGGNG